MKLESSVHATGYKTFPKSFSRSICHSFFSSLHIYMHIFFICINSNGILEQAHTQWADPGRQWECALLQMYCLNFEKITIKMWTYHFILGASMAHISAHHYYCMRKRWIHISLREPYTRNSGTQSTRTPHTQPVDQIKCKFTVDALAPMLGKHTHTHTHTQDFEKKMIASRKWKSAHLCKQNLI